MNFVEIDRAMPSPDSSTEATSYLSSLIPAFDYEKPNIKESSSADGQCGHLRKQNSMDSLDTIGLFGDDLLPGQEDSVLPLQDVADPSNEKLHSSSLSSASFVETLSCDLFLEELTSEEARPETCMSNNASYGLCDTSSMTSNPCTVVSNAPTPPPRVNSPPPMLEGLDLDCPLTPPGSLPYCTVLPQAGWQLSSQPSNLLHGTQESLQVQRDHHVLLPYQNQFQPTPFQAPSNHLLMAPKAGPTRQLPRVAAAAQTAAGQKNQPRKFCTTPNCNNLVVQGGKCISHGARRKKCGHPGCTKNVKRLGRCSAHGPARKRCEVEGCAKVSVRGGLCVCHGAKKRMCDIVGCTKQGIMRGMCKRHHDAVNGVVKVRAPGKKAKLV